MDTVANCPRDLRLVRHRRHSGGYEKTKVLLARADFDGTLQLLTSGWGAALGYPCDKCDGCTLRQLMWSSPGGAAAVVAAILDVLEMGPVDMRVCGGDGLAKGFRLHRHYDRHERLMYIVAEETAAAARAARR